MNIIQKGMCTYYINSSNLKQLKNLYNCVGRKHVFALILCFIVFTSLYRKLLLFFVFNIVQVQFSLLPLNALQIVLQSWVLNTNRYCKCEDQALLIILTMLI